MAKRLVPLHNRKCFCRKLCRIILRCLFLRIKIVLNVVIGFPDSVQYLQRAVSQNIAQLHHIDLYGNIF